MTLLTIYVPARTPHPLIADGSAVVGAGPADAGGRVMVDYEGGLYDQHPVYADRLLHAAGRHEQRYPTVARAWLDPADLVPVGSYDTVTHRAVVDDDAVDLVAGWVGVPAAELPAQLVFYRDR